MSYTPERPPGIRSEPMSHICSECGTVNPRSAGACWLCHAPLLEGAEPHVGHAESSEGNARKSVTALTTLVLLCGLVAFIAVAMIFSADLAAGGVVFLLLAIPILVQIARAALVAGQDRRALSFGQSFGAVLLGIAIAIAMVAATCVMFIVTCLPTSILHGHGGHGDSGLIVAIVVGMIAGMGMAYLLTWAIFRRKKKTDRPA